MGRLPACTSADVARVLRRAGFVLDPQKGSHAQFVHPQTRRMTTLPMHGGDLKRGLLRGILKDAGLTEDEFRRLL